METALQTVLVLSPFTQSEDAGGGVPCERPSKVLAARATQQHVEATGASWLSAAIRHAVSITGQLRHQQHQDQHQDFLLGKKRSVYTQIN